MHPDGFKVTLQAVDIKAFMINARAYGEFPVR